MGPILNFKNFKKVKDKSISFDGDSYIYFINGSNDKGKSSILQAIKAIHTAKLDIDQPVTTGEVAGSIEAINFIGADGNPYTIRVTFDKDGNSKFTAFDQENKKISSVTQIRDIFKYNSFTAEWFMNASLSAKGIEEAKKIFLSMLSSEEAEQYELAILQEKQYYEQRTRANVATKQYTDMVVGLKLTPEETEKLALKDTAKEQLQELEKELSGISVQLERQRGIADKISHINENISKNISDIDRKNKEIERLTAEVVLLNLANKEANKALEELIKQQGTEPINANDLEQRVKVGKEFNEAIIKIEAKKNSYDEMEAKRVEQSLLWQDLDDKVKAEREKQDSIIMNSNNPVKDLRITDNGLMLGDLSFKENQICKSKAMLVGAEIQCAINDSPLLVIGCANDLDNDSLDAMEVIAKKYGKKMIMDQVQREETDLSVTCYDHTNK